jgi:hypothetical protein
MSRHNYSGDALIEVLHTAQEMYGHLTPELLRTIANKLRLPPSHVLGVATFYHFFSLEPKGDNLLIATAQNNLAINRAVEQTARRFVDTGTLTEGMLNRLEAAVRYYDPCLSCSTHALGRMPFVVEVFDASGALVRRLQRR